MDKEIILSPSAVYNFEQCPYAFFETKKYHVRATSDNTELGRLIHASLDALYEPGNQRDLLEIYKKKWSEFCVADKESYKLGKEMIDTYKQRWLGTEGEIICREHHFDLDYDGRFRVRGIMDRVDIVEYYDDVGEADYEIVDYKTSRIAHTWEELEQNLQLAVYDLALRKMIEQKVFGITLPKPRNVYLSMLYLRHDKMTIVHTDEERRELEEFLELTYKQINNCKEAKPKMNTFCPWCDVKDKCELYNMITDNIPKYQQHESINFMTLDELMAEYKKISYLDRLLEDRQKRIRALLEAKLENEGMKSLETKGYKCYFNKRTYRNYDVEKLREILMPLGVFSDVVSVKKKDLDGFVKKYGIEEAVKEAEEEGTTKYYLSVNKKGKKKKG